MTAVIQLAPPSPETSKRWWETYCADCGTHEGLAHSETTAWLIEIRDGHNRMHERTETRP